MTSQFFLEDNKNFNILKILKIQLKDISCKKIAGFFNGNENTECPNIKVGPFLYLGKEQFIRKFTKQVNFDF